MKYRILATVLLLLGVLPVCAAENVCEAGNVCAAGSVFATGSVCAAENVCVGKDVFAAEHTGFGEASVFVSFEIKKMSVYQGIDYSAVYDYDYYLHRYPDVYNICGENDAKVLKHFIEQGMREGRRGTASFDVNAYRYANPDLRKEYREDLPSYYLHFIREGNVEGRTAVGVATLQNPCTVYEGKDYGDVYDFWVFRDICPEAAKQYGMDDYGLLEYYVTNYRQLHSMERLLRTAILPVGHAAYIWGGAWNEADDGAGVEAVTIGVSPRWAEFADAVGADYNYRTTRYQIHDGLDCSGYIGWIVYNALTDRNDGEGYVMYACDMATAFADMGYGEITGGRFLPGDICSMSGHVWMSLGTCADGSVLLVHASPPGVSICGTAAYEGQDSQAVVIARRIMSIYYPEWYARFPKCSVRAGYLTSCVKMSWNRETLSDEQGLQDMSAEEIVDFLYD